jgi:hypothetical protein
MIHHSILYILLIIVLLKLILHTNNIIEGNTSRDFTSCFNRIQPPAYKEFDTETKKVVVREHILKDFVNVIYSKSYLNDATNEDNDILKTNAEDYCYE